MPQTSRFGYTTNTGSGTLSGFSIGRDGRLSLLDPDGATAASAGGLPAGANGLAAR